MKNPNYFHIRDTFANIIPRQGYICQNMIYVTEVKFKGWQFYLTTENNRVPRYLKYFLESGIYHYLQYISTPTRRTANYTKAILEKYSERGFVGKQVNAINVSDSIQTIFIQFWQWRPSLLLDSSGSTIIRDL